ncbi:MAG: DUF72 domain-containing protein [Acidobacteriota bacterium]
MKPLDDRSAAGAAGADPSARRAAIEERAPSAFSIGLPQWANDAWRGSLYRRGGRDHLRQYSEVWTAVEGNTTFYSLPSARTVESWRQATPPTFRFVFKLPRSLTHDALLQNAAGPLDLFFERLDPLGPRVGTTMAQLPPFFGPDRLGDLERFLIRWPSGRPLAVELRHRAFFDLPRAATRADDLLRSHGAERVMLDAHAVWEGDLEHPAVATARHPKPRLPIRATPLGRHPILRFIAHPEPATTLPRLDRWAERLAQWIGEGLRPTAFVHCPVDRRAPELARRLHQLVAARTPLGPLPAWPGEREARAGQMTLPSLGLSSDAQDG